MKYIPAAERRYTTETVHATVDNIRKFLHALPVSASDLEIDLDVLTSMYAELVQYRQLQAVDESKLIDGQYDENEEDQIEDAPGAMTVCQCDSDNDVQATPHGPLCWACREERGWND